MTHKLPRWLLLLGILALGGLARVAVASETEACLACHADKGHAIEFVGGGRLEAYVDEQKFKASVHRFLACTDCHERALTGKGHEQRRFRSEHLFKLRYSRICRGCHTDEEIGGSPVHASLFEQEAAGHAPVCTDCHPAHTVQPVAGGHILAGEEAHCLECHAEQADVITRPGATEGRGLPSPVAHHNLSCSGCHAGYSRQFHPQQGLAVDGGAPVAPEDLCRRCHFDKYTRSLEGIHYGLRSRGNTETPDCVDCHGSHRIVHLSHDRAASAAKCGECHPKLHERYAASVHGDAMSNAHNTDVPVCTDCHHVHDIGNPLVADYRDRIPGICGSCHADRRVMEKYDLSTDVVRTYLDDFHGSTASIYRKQDAGAYRPQRPIAVCTDCHGTHDIKSMSALGTGEIKALLLERCQQCHVRAGSDFPDAWLSHHVPSLATAPARFVADRAYCVLLPLLLLGILLQVLLHVWRHAVDRLATAQATEAHPGSGDDVRLRRFHAGRVVEHLALMLLFLVLAATGLAQKFHGTGIAQSLLALLGGLDVARILHHWAGAALAVLLLQHLVIAGTGIAARGWRASMLVSLQDLRDVARNVRYYLGLCNAPARCDRYSYKQKFTYWSVLLGGLVMALSGFVLWFPIEAARLVPAAVIPLAAAVHSHHALVLLVVVALWHVYDAIFSPEIFPLNTSIFTGRMTRARMRRLHPRELERLDAGEDGSRGRPAER